MNNDHLATVWGVTITGAMLSTINHIVGIVVMCISGAYTLYCWYLKWKRSHITKGDE